MGVCWFRPFFPQKNVEFHIFRISDFRFLVGFQKKIMFARKKMWNLKTRKKVSVESLRFDPPPFAWFRIVNKGGSNEGLRSHVS